MFDVASCSNMFDLIFVTFDNENEQGLNRELVGDELLIDAVDIINLFANIDTNAINEMVWWCCYPNKWFGFIIGKTLSTNWEAYTAIALCVCRAIASLIEDGHLEV